jgi:hypothetical protein
MLLKVTPPGSSGSVGRLLRRRPLARCCGCRKTIVKSLAENRRCLEVNIELQSEVELGENRVRAQYGEIKFRETVLLGFPGVFLQSR